MQQRLLARLGTGIGAGALALGLTTAGCFSNDASGVVALRDYPLGSTPFAAVALNGEGQVSIAPGDFALAVSAEEDVLPSVRVEVRAAQSGAVLVLGRNVDWFDGVRATVPVQFRVTMPRLEAISVAGAGSVAARGFKVGGTLRVAAAGAGQAQVAAIEAAELAVSAEGASRIATTSVRAGAVRYVLRGSARVTASGAAPRAEVEISGAGLFRGSGLRTEEAAVEVTGAGQAFVWAERQLRADVAGIGRIHYRGAPRIDKTLQREGQLLAIDADPEA